MRRAERVRVFAIKGKEIPDGRECMTRRVVKTMVCGEEDEKGLQDR